MRGSPSAREGGRTTRSRSNEAPRRPRTWPALKPDLEKLFEVVLPQGLLGEGEPVDDALSATRLLREMLQRGVVPIGTTIRGERLAVLLGIHRNTMSKVFQMLASEGYLYRRRGRPARVAAHRNVLPKRHSKRVSHSALAKEKRFEIRSRLVRHERMRVGELAPERREKVAERLALEPGSEVVVHSRIRELREPDGVWVPAIAETAYFAATRAPEIGEALEEPGRVNSIHDFLGEHGIDPITGGYEVRIATLPDRFWAGWAAASRTPHDVVAALPFLRFESTTHCHKGAIEFSVAYLAKDFFSLATTDVTLDIDAGAVRETARRISSAQQSEASPAGARPPAKRVPPAKASGRSPR